MELLALANGLAFGFWGGLAVTWSGCMLSAFSIYAAGRLWGRPFLERTISRRHQERLDAWFEREGAFPLLALRLVPFNAVCLAAGAVRLAVDLCLDYRCWDPTSSDRRLPSRESHGWE